VRHVMSGGVYFHCVYLQSPLHFLCSLPSPVHPFQSNRTLPLPPSSPPPHSALAKRVNESLPTDARVWKEHCPNLAPLPSNTSAVLCDAMLYPHSEFEKLFFLLSSCLTTFLCNHHPSNTKHQTPITNPVFFRGPFHPLPSL